MGSIIPIMGAKANISNTLFTQTQSRVLGLLFGNPGRSFFANEIMRAAGKGVGAVHRELARLVSAGLVTSKRVGNQRHYQANRQSPIFDELASIVAKISETVMPAFSVAEDRATYKVGGNIPVSRRSLTALCRKNHVKRLSLFGSAARPDFGADSDIDLLVEFESGRTPGLFGLVDLRDSFSRIFAGRRVDLVTQAVLKNPYRKKSIERDLKTLYAA